MNFNPLHSWAPQIAAKREKLETDRLALEADKQASTPSSNLIDMFNLAYTPQERMLLAGYDQRGDSFRHPGSESGSHSATVKDGRVNALSPNDPLYTNGKGARDAFDVFTILFHGGDTNAALKDAGDNYLSINGVSWNKAKQVEYAKKQTIALLTANTQTMADSPEVTQPIGWRATLSAHVEQWNKTHASVTVGGKHRIMRTVTGVDGRLSYDFINRKDLELLYDNTSIQVDEKITGSAIKPVYANHAIAWARHPNSLSYTGGVVFLPGRPAPPAYFNTWRGFNIEPKENDAVLDSINYHIKEVVCAGHQDLYDYFIKWIAYTIQNPDKPVGAAIVVRGEKGSGKGVLGHFLKNLWGNHGLHISNARHLVGNFNAHLSDVCFLFADEAFYSGDKQHEGVLKALITEPSLTIERKGIDVVSQPNYLKVYMATNSEYAVPASKDERRYCVLDISSRCIGNRAYFNKLYADCCSTDVQSAFLYAMLHVDLAGFHTGDIPDSIGLRAQRYHSMNSVQKWLVDALHNGGFSFGDWQTEMSSSQLHCQYSSWCETAKAGEYRRESQTMLGRYLGRVFKRVKKAGGHHWYYFGDLDTAIKTFERYENVGIDELIL